MKKMKTINVIDINGEQKTVPLVDEKEYRKRLLGEARFKGCEIEMRMIFDKFDKMLRTCSNDEEKKAIGAMGVMEISKLLDSKDVGAGGSLIINNKVIISG